MKKEDTYNILYKEWHKLEQVPGLSKHDIVVRGVNTILSENQVAIGYKMPSVVQTAKELGYANRTVAEAYETLKGQGLIESRSTKGYFVCSLDTDTKLKIALIMYAFHSFQETFYNIFREQLGESYRIDVFFHHNNISLFKTILETTQYNYGMYVIAPIQEPEIVDRIQQISPEKVLLIDRFIKIPKDYSYVVQEFEYTTYHKLLELLPNIQKFDKFVLFFKEEGDYPKGIYRGFMNFTEDYSIEAEVWETYTSNKLTSNTLYYFIGDSFYWELLRDVQQQGYQVGNDIGIISQNDSIDKEITFGGITTLSTDFTQMAKQAAIHIQTRKKVRSIIPSRLIRRNSL